MSARFLVSATLALALLGAGCGFRLRSDFSVPPEMAVTYVDGDARSELVIGLKRALRASEVEITETLDQATAVLRVFGERSGRRVLSVSSGGAVSEYEVYYAVSFQVAYPNSERPAQEAQALRLTRDYVFDAAGVLSASEEEQTLRAEMRRDLVRLIMVRLQAK